MRCWVCEAFETPDPRTFQDHVNACNRDDERAAAWPELWSLFVPRLHAASVTTGWGPAVESPDTWPSPDPAALSSLSHSTRAIVVRGGFAYTLGPAPGAYGANASACADAQLVLETASADGRRRMLWLGSEAAARSEAWLRMAGITAIVNCAHNSEPLGAVELARAGVTHCARLPLVDAAEVPGQDALALICSGAAAVAAAFSGGGGRGHERVLVHCVAGVSRSASVVLAYLVQHEGVPLAAAAAAVKAARPVVHPNLGFWRALQAIDAAAHGACSVPDAALAACHRGAEFPVSTHVFGARSRS